MKEHFMYKNTPNEYSVDVLVCAKLLGWEGEDSVVCIVLWFCCLLMCLCIVRCSATIWVQKHFYRRKS